MQSKDLRKPPSGRFPSFMDEWANFVTNLMRFRTMKFLTERPVQPPKPIKLTFNAKKNFYRKMVGLKQFSLGSDPVLAQRLAWEIEQIWSGLVADGGREWTQEALQDVEVMRAVIYDPDAPQQAIDALYRFAGVANPPPAGPGRAPDNEGQRGPGPDTSCAGGCQCDPALHRVGSILYDNLSDRLADKLYASFQDVEVLYSAEELQAISTAMDEHAALREGLPQDQAQYIHHQVRVKLERLLDPPPAM